MSDPSRRFHDERSSTSPWFSAFQDQVPWQLSHAPLVAGDIAEAAPLLAADAGLEEVADAFLADARNEYVVLVDAARRPTAIVDRSALVRDDLYVHEVATVLAGSSLSASARTATARDVSERLLPLVCCDAGGRVIGVVRIDRLLSAFAAEL